MLGCMSIYIIMNQQKLSKTIKQKLVSYFKSICSGNTMRQDDSASEASSIQAKNIHKRRRLTFMLDEVLIKLTRKNIVLQEFQAYTFDLQIPLILERHLSQRINEISIAVFSGKFTKNSMNNVLFPIRIIKKPLLHSSQQNLVLSTRQIPIKMSDRIDVLVEQIKQNPLKSIEKILMKYHMSIKRIVFVCHKEINSQEVIGILRPFKNYYLFEIQRIMSLDKCINTVIYASKCHNFINIEKQSMTQFYISELAKKNTLLDKYQFNHMLDKLLEQNYYVQVASTFGELIKNQKALHAFDKEFIKLIKRKYPYVKIATNGLDAQDNNVSFAIRNRQKTIVCEDTPLFGVRRRSRTTGDYQQSFPIENILKIEQLQSFSQSTSVNMQEHSS